MIFRLFIIIQCVLRICASAQAQECIKSIDSLYGLFSRGEKSLYIKGVFDLGKETLFIPQNTTLVFGPGARIENGVIVGNKTTISSKSNKPIFKNISFEGFFIGKPLVEWFSLKYDIKIDNSFELNAALDLAYHSSIKEIKLPKSKVLYVRSDIENTKVRDFLREGTVEVKSNVRFDLNNSTIMCLPNSAKQYNILFSRDAENIIICNGIICGDLGEHDGDKGEWGYGIELQGVHGFILENLECKYCWGDGINIQVSSDGDGNIDSEVTRRGHCSDGTIRYVNCHHNRRQGMSVEGIIGLEIFNSSFCQSNGARPQSGLDLEPYSPNNVVANITIRNCEFKNNAYSGVLMMSMDNNITDILIDSCKFFDNHVCDVTIRANNVTVRNCSLDKMGFSLKFVGDCEGINVVDSRLSEISTQDFTKDHYVRKVVFSNCSMTINKKTYAAFEEDLRLTDCDMTYNNCVFDFSKANLEKGVFVFSGNSANSYAYINCSFNLGDNQLRVVRSQTFKDCEFFVTKKDNHKIKQYLENNSMLFSRCVVREEKSSCLW